jgi:hypothetical protein
MNVAHGCVFKLSITIKPIIPPNVPMRKHIIYFSQKRKRKSREDCNNQIHPASYK